MPEGKYALQITLLTPGNRPIPNVAITGITTITGGAVTTDTNGKAFGFATSNPVTVTADLSKFLDLSGNASQSFSLTSGIVNQGVITATRASSAQKLLTSSGSFYFSPDVAEYDWSAIGGGYNGNSSTFVSGDPSVGYSGSGGAAGGVINNANVSYNNELLTVVIGASGGGKSSLNGTQTGNGVSGGRGGYGKITYYGGVEQQIAPGNGSNTTGFLYPPTSVGGSGGGGSFYLMDHMRKEDEAAGPIDMSAGKGGSPGGGDGGRPGTAYGAGGGGGALHDNSTSNITGGVGKAGCLGFMWRFKS